MKTVLFVCFHNVGRSQMAEAFFNRFARERGFDLRALSAGTLPKFREINPVVVEAMNEVGISMEGQTPKQLKQGDVDIAARVITMHCGVDPVRCPSGLPESCEDWNLADPAGQPIETVRQIRDDIRGRVEALLQDMQAQSLVETGQREGGRR
jgi:arsenate reductase